MKAKKVNTLILLMLLIQLTYDIILFVQVWQTLAVAWKGVLYNVCFR